MKKRTRIICKKGDYCSKTKCIENAIPKVKKMIKNNENLKIPYMMFGIANFLTTEISFDTIKNIHRIKGDLQKQRIDKLEIENILTFCRTADTIQTLKDKINWDNFVWTSDFKIDGIGDGFTEYLINKGEPFKYNGNHPDEKQHLNFFNDIIYPNFQIRNKLV